MKFLDQLATQSDLKIAGKKSLRPNDLAISPDIVEVEIHEDTPLSPNSSSPATLPPASAETILMPQASAHEESPPEAEIQLPVEAASITPDQIFIPPPEEEQSVVSSPEPERIIEQVEVPVEATIEVKEREAEPPPAASLDAVFAWIAKGENTSPLEADLPQEVQETSGEQATFPHHENAKPEPPLEEIREELIPLKAKSIMAVQAKPPGEPPVPQAASPAPAGAREKKEPSKPEGPSISIGAVHVTVDTGALPAPIQAPRPTPRAAPTPRSSSRTQLRRHYIIPH